jgi:hypothetical protein
MYQKNIDKVKIHEKTFPLELFDICDDVVTEINSKISQYWETNNQNGLSIDNYEIVRWPVNSFQQSHYDHVHNVYGIIVYLNSNFLGGNTCFYPNIKITPETGKLLAFSGSKILHWVESVRNYDRYTLAYWFNQIKK